MDDPLPGGATVTTNTFQQPLSKPSPCEGRSFKRSPSQCQRLRRHFSACAGIVCAHLPLGRVRSFCRLRLPTAQLRARRYTNRSKRCDFSRRESCYLASFRQAKATQQPRPALTFRAVLGTRDPPKFKVVTRADSRFPLNSGISPTACAFR